jgi:hypothetical protein
LAGHNGLRTAPRKSVPPAAWILGDWQMNMITQIRSGQPFNLVVTGEVANIGNNSTRNYARPNLICNPYVSSPTDGAWFNPVAFAVPTFSYGNFGRSPIHP